MSLAGRGRRLWLAGAEKALCAGGRPVALLWRSGRINLVAEILAEHGQVPAGDGARVVALRGEPGARFAHLAPIADLLAAHRIGMVGRLSWASGRLWLGPVTQPAGEPSIGHDWRARVLRADGRLGVGPLRGQGVLPRLVRIHARTTSPRVELRVGMRLDPDDPSVVPVRGHAAAPYVYLTGPVGRRAREVLGTKGLRDVRVWVRAELGALVVVPLAPDLRAGRPDGETGAGPAKTDGRVDGQPGGGQLGAGPADAGQPGGKGGGNP